MKRLKRIIVSLLIILLLPLNSFAASKSIQVTLPKYPITINGMKVDNDCRQYPFIVYKGVTYLPLTYYDSRALGIETVLTEADGLTLDKTGISGGYRDHRGNQKNRNSQVASLPSFLIKINGKVIANNQQPYPILMLRKIAYLPITTDVAKNQLGIDYQFSEKTGLQLKSSGLQIKEIKLPIVLDKPYELGDTSDFMVAKGYLYYTSKKGEIYQMVIDKVTKPKKIYQLPYYSGEFITDNPEDKSSYVEAEYTKEHGEAVLNYHRGGGAMGEDYKIQLNSNRTTKEKENNKYTMSRYIGDKRIGIPIFEDDPGKIFIQTKDGASESIGDIRYLYGREWKQLNKGETPHGMERNDTIYIYDNKVYVLACNMEKSDAVTSVHSIDLKTHETVPVLEGEVFKFKMEGDRIYYNQGNQFYVQSIHNKDKKKIAIRQRQGDWKLDFEVLGHLIYYKDKKTGEIYRCDENGKNEPLNPGARLMSFRKCDEYILATFKEEQKTKYRLMVFDKTGEVVLKSADTPSIGNIIIENNQLFYRNKDGKIYRTILK
ncbi:MAG: hypothetical protein AB9856_05620 [Cellulosilyticaceae bacterium]